MSTILLSIKPEYADKIIAGIKKFEFRKHLAQGDIQKIIIYSTAPEKKIIGEVEVVGTLSMKKTPLWEMTKSNAGICRQKYREYFTGCSIAHAYVLGKAKRYDIPKSLLDLKIKQPPQSFVYVSEKMMDRK